MSFCEMLLIFRDPPPPTLIPSMLEAEAITTASPVFDRAFQIGALCSPSELRHRLKFHARGLSYACGVLRHETFHVNLSAPE